ncbi:MAG: type II toxin-antitoxin system PemK/MazF family toxin [Alphaproteobacteria bacterium]|nr:type II toxin-antitoxin system PemK/MazF family toxin [Alphaproteobacteria bacterium]
MVRGGRFPARGDIFHLDFHPAAGHEMTGPHYCVVVSPEAYNAVSRMPYVAPITTAGTQSRMAGMAVNLTGTGLKVSGVVQCDQVKAVDLEARRAKPTGEKVPDDIMDVMLALLAPVLGPEGE